MGRAIPKGGKRTAHLYNEPLLAGRNDARVCWRFVFSYQRFAYGNALAGATIDAVHIRVKTTAMATCALASSR